MFRKAIIAIAVSAIALPASLWARGQGSTYYFLSPDGMSVELGTQDRKNPVISNVDYDSELVYQREKKELRAVTFGGKVLWNIKRPEEEGPSYFDSSSGVLNITQYLGSSWLGLDPKTGKQVFKKPAEQPSRVNRALSEIEDTREPQPFWYFVADTEDKRHVLKKFDRRTGTQVWQKQLPEKVAQWGDLQFASVGIVQWEKGMYCFDPGSGAELTKIPTDAKTTREVFWHADGIFHLSTEANATLTAFAPKTEKVLWSIKDLKGALDLTGPYMHNRLLCRADGATYVIDTKAGKLLAQLKTGGYPRGVFQTKDAIVVWYWDPKCGVECFEMPSGKLAWSRMHAGQYGAAALWNDRVMIVEPSKRKRGAPPPPVSVVSLKDGKELWRWQVPEFKNQFYDVIWASVHATKSGFVVTRTWRVLD